MTINPMESAALKFTQLMSFTIKLRLSYFITMISLTIPLNSIRMTAVVVPLVAAMEQSAIRKQTLQ